MHTGKTGHTKTTQSNPIPTSSFSMLSFCRLHYEIAGNSTDGEKRRCRYEVTCVVFACPVLSACILPSLHLVSVVFGTAIPTSLYIFGKCFLYL